MAAESLSSQHREYVAMMQRSGRHLLLVVNDILDFSRIEAGRLELEHTAFAIKELVEELRQLMTPRAHERGLRLVFELSDSVPSGVVGDRTRLAQILINLIDNAVKFTGEGQITVRLSAQELSEGRVRLRFDVIDTGPGIPQEYQSCLFEPFTQADNSTTRRFGGSGLGLAISKRLIDIMGGAIGVESSLGKGSHFWFQLVTETGVPVRRAENFAFEYHKASPKRVLLVEDVEVNRRLLGEVLRRQGHEVVIATNGAEAVELVRRRDIDVVLMDVQMPVMDGVEATRRIRELGGESGNVRIIGLTAYVLQGKREECLRAGMDAVLIKPLDWHALLSVLNDEPVSIVRETAVLGERAYPAQTFEPSSVLNGRVIADWRERLAPLAWSELIQSVLRDARDTFEVMRSLPKGSRELAEVAHQLKGTSGFVGFEKLSILAGELERVAKAGDDGAGLVDKIGAALMATTIELQGSGDVNPSATVTRMVVETDPADLIS
jgi:CheY-like chemotaxis protein